MLTAGCLAAGLAWGAHQEAAASAQVAGAGVACAPAPAGLVAWWRAEGTAQDSAQYLHGSPSNGTGFAPGRTGQGFFFDGIDDYVDVPPDPVLTTLTQGTIEMWMRIHSTDTTTARLFALSRQGAPFPQSEQWSVDYRSTGEIQVTLVRNGRVELGAFTPPGTIADTEWHHVAVVSDGVDALQVYVDGVSQPLLDAFNGGAGVDVFLAHAAGANRIGIGGIVRDSLAADGVKTIDEMAIYSRPLSAAEIAGLFAAGGAGKCFQNRPPVIWTPDNRTSLAGQTVTMNVPASDPDHDPLTFSAAGLPPGLAIDSSTGVVSGTIATTAGGDYSVNVSVSDGSLSASTSFEWTVIPSEYTLTVAVSGAKGGVTSLPARIDCAGACAAPFPRGSAVTLTPAAPAGYAFRGWTGDCSGTGACLVVLDRARAVGATFSRQKVVISQVYGGGGDAGSEYRSDFIELFNADTAPVALTGWSVQYAAASGTTWQVTPLPAFALAPGTFLLIGEAGGSNGTLSLPVPYVPGTIAMHAVSGRVVVVPSTAPLACGTSCGASTDVNDFVGYGAANDYEGVAAAPVLDVSSAAVRLGACFDRDQNGRDFWFARPAPRNSATPAVDCSTAAPPAYLVIPERINVVDAVTPLPSAMFTVKETVRVTDTVRALPSAMLFVPERITVRDSVDVVNTPTGTNVTVQPTPTAPVTTTVTMTFSSVTDGGVTAVAPLGSGPIVESDFMFGSPPQVYDLTTTASFSGPVTACFTYVPSAYLKPSALRVLHYEGGVWVDRTVSIDTVKCIVCAQVTSLSPFALVERAFTGSQIGAGFVDTPAGRVHFTLQIEEAHLGVERGTLRVWTTGTGAAPAARFESSSVRSIALSSDGAAFSGAGTWNGAAGYFFNARAIDEAEPGGRADTFAVTVRDGSGNVVFTAEGTLSGGNIQARRGKS